MKTKSLRFLGLGYVVVASVCAVWSGRAVPISGAISFGGQAMLNATDLNSASAITSYVPNSTYIAGSGSGAFQFIPSLTPATMVAFSFGSNLLSPNPVTLWQVLYNGVTYTFDASSVAVQSRSSTYLQIGGLGTAFISGGATAYDPTVGSWKIGFNDASGGTLQSFSFSFSGATTVPAVPDGGTTVAMLGAALLGLTMLRRRFA